MAVHGAALAQLGFDVKWLLKEAKILIRTRVIKTATAFAPEPSNEPEEAPAPEVSSQSVWSLAIPFVMLQQSAVLSSTRPSCTKCLAAPVKGLPSALQRPGKGSKIPAFSQRTQHKSCV